MAISPESYSQVKDILRKLDRSIDDARTRRVRDNGPPAVVQHAALGQPRPNPGLSQNGNGAGQKPGLPGMASPSPVHQLARPKHRDPSQFSN